MMKWTVRISSRHQVWDDNSNGTKYQTVFFTALSDLSKRHCSRQAKRGQPAIVQSAHAFRSHSSEKFPTPHRIQTSDLACQVSSLHYIKYLRKLAAGIFLNARWSAPRVSLMVSVVYMYICICQVMVLSRSPQNHHWNLCYESTPSDFCHKSETEWKTVSGCSTACQHWTEKDVFPFVWLPNIWNFACDWPGQTP